MEAEVNILKKQAGRRSSALRPHLRQDGMHHVERLRRREHFLQLVLELFFRLKLACRLALRQHQPGAPFNDFFCR